MAVYNEYNVPPQYIRFDDHVIAPDEYLNTRDMHVFMENHNILLARRQKRILYTMGAGVSALFFSSARPADVANGDVWLSVPLRFSPYTKEITFSVVAQSMMVASSIYLYPVIAAPGASAALSVALEITTVIGTRSVDVPVPPEAAENGSGRLTVYFGGGTEGADILAGLAVQVSSVFGSRSVDIDIAAGAAPAVDDVAYFSDASIEARLITDVANIGGTIRRVWFDAGLNKLPIPGTDTFATKAAMKVAAVGATVFEKSIAAFSDDPGVIY